MERTALKVVPEELKSILGMQKPVTLPEMDEVEAIEFLRDRLRNFRPIKYRGDDFTPFGKDVVAQGIKTIAFADTVSLIPRTILQTMGHLYDEIPESGGPLDIETAAKILEDLNWSGHVEDE